MDIKHVNTGTCSTETIAVSFKLDQNAIHKFYLKNQKLNDAQTENLFTKCFSHQKKIYLLIFSHKAGLEQFDLLKFNNSNFCRKKKLLRGQMLLKVTIYLFQFPIFHSPCLITRNDFQIIISILIVDECVLKLIQIAIYKHF